MKRKTLSQLHKKATLVFNKVIRLRDKDKGCISCGDPVQHAGHYYSAGQYPSLRYLVVNVHGQCVVCNNFKHGNLIEYRKGLIKRYGEDFVLVLDELAEHYKQNPWKWDRAYLEDIINIYKQSE
jgi:hypothetical protein